jgi:hypothetical protein
VNDGAPVEIGTGRGGCSGAGRKDQIMKPLLEKLALATMLALAPALAVACSSDNSVDTMNGKAISDLDIGGDVTIDKGATKQLTATVKYADGTSADVTSSADLVWNIGDTSIATVSKTGVITGTGVGATKITATYQGKTSADHALIVH